MKKYLLKDLKHGNSKIYTISLIVAFLVMATSVFAQVQPDKLRIVPTLTGDLATEWLINDHITDTVCNHPAFFNKPDHFSNAELQVTQTGDWIEYQMTAPVAGRYAVFVGLATQALDGEVNVSIYETVGGSFVMDGLTVKTYNGQWHTYPEYAFPFELEENKVYTLRISMVVGGTNVGSIRTTAITGSTDATLSDLRINGTTIEGFDPNVYSYYIPMPVDVWIDSMGVTTNHDSATAAVPTDFTLDGVAATYTITVTSESLIPQDYTITAASPIFLYDQLSWPAAELGSNIYYNLGVNVKSTVLNSFNNGAYVDYYVYSDYDDNLLLTVNYANGYADGTNSNFNVSTLGVNDTAWTVNEIYTGHLPITYNAEEVSSWDAADAQDASFVFSVKANEPTLLRIYSVTTKGNAANVYGMSFSVIYESIDATLSDLTVDGTTVEGFDPMSLSYKVPVPAGASSVNVAATTTNAAALATKGTGAISIVGFTTADTVTVTSEYGNTIDYKLNLYSPIEVSGDTTYLIMADQRYETGSLADHGGVGGNNTTMNWFQDGDYVDYYIYSLTDREVDLLALAANGNQDTTVSKLNVSTYAVGTEWALDTALSTIIPLGLADLWDLDFAAEVRSKKVSLVANEAVMLRLYAETNAPNTIANIYGLALVESTDTASTAIENVETSRLTVYGGEGRLTVLCDEVYVGGSVYIFDISGRLITRELVESTRNDYALHRGGLYIVRAVDRNNNVSTAKCIVK